MSETILPISEPQLTYVRNLARKLSLPERMVSDHCVARFGVELRQLSKSDASKLLDEMLSWQDVPAELKRAQGQADLPGFG